MERKALRASGLAGAKWTTGKRVTCPCNLRLPLNFALCSEKKPTKTNMNTTIINSLDVLDLVKKLDFPRALGTKGESRAFEVVKKELKDLGVHGVYEDFNSSWLEFSNSCIEINKLQIPITPLVNPLYNTQWQPIPRAVEIKGKLTDIPTPKNNNRAHIVLRKYYEEKEPCLAGADAQLFIAPPDDTFIAYYLACEKSIPTAYCNLEYEDFLVKSLGNICRFYWHSIECKKALKNLVAEIKGTVFLNDVIIVGAHIDSFPGTVGASDNACGSAILVEFIKYFVKYPPARTIRFVWFTGEELGLQGSYSYLKTHLYERDIFRLYINVDTGFSVEHGVPYVTVTGKKELVTNLKTLTAKLAQGIPVHESNSTSGDAIPFNENSIATVFVCARNTKPYPHPHLPNDTFDKLDLRKIQLIGDLSLNIIDKAQQGKLF